MPRLSSSPKAVFDETLHKLLGTYLQYATRPYDPPPTDMSTAVLETEGRLHRQVFMVLARMSTPVESRADHITPSVYADIIYEHWLFDVPKLIDIASIYCPANLPAVQKMIASIQG